MKSIQKRHQVKQFREARERNSTCRLRCLNHVLHLIFLFLHVIDHRVDKTFRDPNLSLLYLYLNQKLCPLKPICFRLCQNFLIERNSHPMAGLSPLFPSSSKTQGKVHFQVSMLVTPVASVGKLSIIN